MTRYIDISKIPGCVKTPDDRHSLAGWLSDMERAVSALMQMSSDGFLSEEEFVYIKTRFPQSYFTKNFMNFNEFQRRLAFYVDDQRFCNPRCQPEFHLPENRKEICAFRLKRWIEVDESPAPLLRHK